MGDHNNKICVRCNSQPKMPRSKTNKCLYPYCKKCHAEISKQWAKNNCDKIKRQKKKIVKPRKKRIPQNQVERLFFAEVLLTPETYKECIEWKFTLRNNRYGYFYLAPNRSDVVHRLMLEEFTGQILPRSLDTSHLCHNTKCINPWHLIAESHKENIQRAFNDARNHHKNNKE